MDDYDAYLFDWDGTLAQSHGMWLELLRRQLEPCGIHLTDEQLVRQIFGRYDEGLRELGFSDEQIDSMGAELGDAAKQQFPLVTLFPQAHKVLELLSARGKKLALVTATYRDVINIAVGHHGLIELFEVIVTGDEMKAQKPDPSGLQMALKRLGVPPKRAIMVGDSPKDLLAGNNAGTDTLLFYPADHQMQHPRAALEACNPTYTIRSWQEFIDANRHSPRTSRRKV